MIRALRLPSLRPTCRLGLLISALLVWICPAIAQVEGYSDVIVDNAASEVYACSETIISPDLAGDYGVYQKGYLFSDGNQIRQGASSGKQDTGEICI